MKIILSYFFISLTFGLFSQTKIEEIDASLSAYNQKLQEAGEYEEAMPRLTINCNLTQRAIGEVNHFATLYFDRNDELIEPEDDEGEMIEVHTATLRKVLFTLKTGSYETEYTYYYNSNSKLICYQEKNTGSSCFKITYYYNNDKCLKIEKEPTLNEFCEGTESTERTVFTADDRHDITAHLKESERFKTLLETYYSVITW